MPASVALAASDTPPPAEPAADASRDEAVARIMAMSQYLASLPGLRVTLLGSYDAMQDSGQKIEFHEIREIALARPDRLSVRVTRSDGEESRLLFDGKVISALDGAAEVYAQAPQPAALDDAIVYFVRDLGMRLPLARLFTTRAPDELGRNLRDLAYVERTAVLPVPTHHIVGRGDGVDVQVWIADGDRPLPLRIVLTYVDEPGQPQYRAQFLDWKTEPPTDPDVFRFTAPEGARRIPFAVALAPTAGASSTRPGPGVQP
jgi:hypothetical protein